MTTMQRLFFGCMLFPGGIVKAEDATELRLVVNVSNLAGFDRATITSAEQIVTGSFRRLGIEVAWQRAVSIGDLDAGADAEGRARRVGQPGPYYPQPGWAPNPYAAGLAACRQMVNRFEDLGFPAHSGGCYRQDGVPDAAVDPTRLRNVLLGHVMAHEMGICCWVQQGTRARAS